VTSKKALTGKGREEKRSSEYDSKKQETKKKHSKPGTDPM
jgi:hypothetical protein